MQTAEWLDQDANAAAGGGAAVTAAAGDEVEIREDEEGQRYSWNPRLQTAEWLD